MNHHRNGLVGVEVGLPLHARQSQQGFLGLLGLALPDQPPWRLRGERNADEEGQGPHPLQSIGDPVRPLVIPINHTLDHTDTDQLSQSPAEVDIGREVPTQRNRTHLRSIGDGQCLKNTPRNTGQNFRSQQRLDIRGGEEDGGPRCDQNETSHDSITISEAFRSPAINEKADNFSDIGAVTQTRLPLYRRLLSADFVTRALHDVRDNSAIAGRSQGDRGEGVNYPCWHLICPIRRQLAIFPVELRESVEVVDETDIVAFHDNAGGDQDTPSDGLGVELDTLEQGHLLLLIRGRFGILDDLGCGSHGILAIGGGRWRLLCRGNGIRNLVGSHAGEQLQAIPGEGEKKVKGGEEGGKEEVKGERGGRRRS